MRTVVVCMGQLRQIGLLHKISLISLVALLLAGKDHRDRIRLLADFHVSHLGLTPTRITMLIYTSRGGFDSAIHVNGMAESTGHSSFREEVLVKQLLDGIRAAGWEPRARAAGFERRAACGATIVLRKPLAEMPP